MGPGVPAAGTLQVLAKRSSTSQNTLLAPQRAHLTLSFSDL